MPKKSPPVAEASMLQSRKVHVVPLVGFQRGIKVHLSVKHEWRVNIFRHAEELRTTWRLQRQATVGHQTLARPQRQLQARFQVEECDGSVLDLRTNDSFRCEAETVSVEGHGAFEVVDSEGNERDVRLHGVSAVCLRRLTFDMRGTQKAQPFGHPLDGRVRRHGSACSVFRHWERKGTRGESGACEDARFRTTH
jgi:hypothetical protein